MILAGGQGERLYPLTRDRAKPAVPFGGVYRIIDFTLSNCINSGVRRIFVLTQYKSSSLDNHIRFGWSILSHQLGEFVATIPPQQRVGDTWYRGTADAIYQNIYTLERERPDRVLVLSGDHIYKMNYRAMIDAHRATRAHLTIACIPVPREDAKNLGVAVVDAEGRIVQFQEKSPDPVPLPDDPHLCLANMGVYLFDTAVLVREVADDFKRDSDHDFGKNIIPRMIHTHRVFAHDFQDENRKPVKYWRDIGTLDAYWEANMDLVAIDPAFNLYDRHWPIRTLPSHLPPAKTVLDDNGRRGSAINSLISPGVIISGGAVERSVLGPGVRIEEGACVAESVILDDTVVGHGATIHRAIIDKRVTIPPGTRIGLDPLADAERYVITEKHAIAVIPREMRIGAPEPRP